MEAGYDRNQYYRRVGEVIHAVLSEGNQSFAAFSPGQPRGFPTLLALVTFLQYAEGYTDRQAAEAARVRSDWKYVLHLPLSYPGFDPIWLCRLREHVFRSPSAAAGMGELFKRLGSTGLFEQCVFVPDSNQSSPELLILGSICRLNRLVQVTEATLLAVEALAAQESSRLPALWLSRLFEANAKTFRSLREVQTAADAACLVGGIGRDIACLLDCVETSGEENLVALPEIGHLREIFEANYDRAEDHRPGETFWIWRPVDCDLCGPASKGGMNG
jgi:hypothetical protein